MAGPYVDQTNGSGVWGSFSFNIWAWEHSNAMSNKPDPNAKVPRERSMIFDLSHPVPGSGATSLVTTWDELARFHIFWKHNY